MSQTTKRSASAHNDWDQIEATIAAFEAAWLRGDRPRLADQIAEANPLRSAILVELIHAEIEFRLKAGEPARVEAYLATYPELNARPEALVSLIRTEWAVRVRSEPDLLIDHFLARFPHLAEFLAASLVGVGPDRSVAPPRSVPALSGLDAPLPRRLGKYELLQKVGEGGFGFVFRARDTILQHDVALKIPRPEVAASPVDLLHFLREAKNAIHLRHPNIVAIQDAGPIDGTVCLISEFIQGMTLADRLRVGPLGVTESVQLMVPILEALSHAHRRGIIHRDLKPSNILLDRDDVPHLADFGLAKRATGDSTLSPLGATRVLIGIPAYMAPEQARGDSASVDALSDIYTAGVVLYEMLTGSVPFGGRGRLLQIQIEEADPRPPRELNDEIPSDLETICLRALAKHPADRYRSASVMADDLANFRAGQPIAARRIVALPLSFWARHRGQLGRVILGLAGCGVVISLGWQWREMKRQIAGDSALIERLVRESVAVTRLPLRFGSSPAQEHRRLVNAIWGHSRTWFDALANQPALAEYQVDLLIQAADHAAEVGSDLATRAAWQEAVEALEPLAQGRGAASERSIDLARALTELGELHAIAGTRVEARRCSERAALTWNRVAEGLRDQFATLPNDPATRLSLAEAILHGDRAARQANQGGTASAVAEAELIADELRLRGHLAPTEITRLGSIQLALARRYQAFGQPNQVALWGGRALRSARSAPHLPNDPQANVAAARADLFVGLATADGAAGVQDDLAGGAAAQLQSAIITFTQASRLDPTDWLLQRDLATAQTGLAALLTRRCRHDAAARWFTLALQTMSDLQALRPNAHVDLAAAAEIHAGLARIDWHRNQTWEAHRRTIMAVLLAHRAARLAPGIAGYRHARNQYALTLLPLNHPACSGCFPIASPPQANPNHREIELP